MQRLCSLCGSSRGSIIDLCDRCRKYVDSKFHDEFFIETYMNKKKNSKALADVAVYREEHNASPRQASVRKQMVVKQLNLFANEKTYRQCVRKTH